MYADKGQLGMQVMHALAHPELLARACIPMAGKNPSGRKKVQVLVKLVKVQVELTWWKFTIPQETR